MFAVARFVTNHDDLWAAIIAGGVAIGVAVLRGRQVVRKLGEPNGAGTIANMILNVHDEARAAREEAVTAASVASEAVHEHTLSDEQRFAEVSASFDALRGETTSEIAALRVEMRDGFVSLGHIIDSALGVRPPKEKP